MPICLPTFAGVAQPASSGGTPFTNEFSVSLDGTNDYMTTDNSVFNFYNTGGSISAWIKPSSVTGTGTDAFKNRSIINKGNVYLSLNVDESGYPVLYFYDGAVREVVATTQVSTSSWMHICATWSTTGSSIYVNGTSEATSSETPANITSGQTGATVYMGRTPTAWDYFGGLIDELAVFNTELSSSNVSTIYNSGVPSDISALSPVNWWRMGDNDGGTGNTITDQGSGGNNTTLFNGPTFSTSVPEYVFNQYSVDFDATNDEMTFDGTSMTGLSSFSISMWLYQRSTTDGVIFGNFGAGISQGWMFYGYGTTSIKFYSSNGSYVSFGTIPQTLNSWQHIVGVNDNGSGSLYLNGSLNATSTGLATNFSSTYNNGELGQIVNGLIDEVSTFNTALSSADVTAMYNSGVPNDLTQAASYNTDRTANLVNYWRMGDNDGGTGTTITDQGSGSDDGTLVNGPTFSSTVPS